MDKDISKLVQRLDSQQRETSSLQNRYINRNINNTIQKTFKELQECGISLEVKVEGPSNYVMSLSSPIINDNQREIISKILDLLSNEITIKEAQIKILSEEKEKLNEADSSIFNTIDALEQSPIGILSQDIFEIADQQSTLLEKSSSKQLLLESATSKLEKLRMIESTLLESIQQNLIHMDDDSPTQRDALKALIGTPDQSSAATQIRGHRSTSSSSSEGQKRQRIT